MRETSEPARVRRARKRTCPDFLFGVAATLALSACSAPLARSVPEAELLAGGRFQVIDGIDVPHVEGADGCGAQALAAVMAFHDPAVNAESLDEDLPWHDFGATPVDVLVEARRRGDVAVIERGTWNRLRELIDDRRPPLVMFDSGVHVKSWLAAAVPPPPVMHWGVMSGIAHDDSRILIAATGARHHLIARDEFLKRWAASDYCTVIIGGPN